MHISRLALDHYRSWSQVVVDFVPGVNILFGKNGLGKTNLVEAVEEQGCGKRPSSVHRIEPSHVQHVAADRTRADHGHHPRERR